MGRFRTTAIGAVAIVAVVVLTGCMTGERPTLLPAKADPSDPAVLAVVDRLESPNATQFTATYSIVTKIGATAVPTTSATVGQSSATARSVTVGNLRFLDQDGTEQTCDLTTSTCSAGFDDAGLSTILVTHDFYSASPAARLRQDAATMVNAAVASTRVIGGQNATCVQVNFASGSKQYCALDNGLLAYQDTPDLQIDLLSLTPGADPALFSPVAPPLTSGATPVSTTTPG